MIKSMTTLGLLVSFVVGASAFAAEGKFCGSIEAQSAGAGKVALIQFDKAKNTYNATELKGKEETIARLRQLVGFREVCVIGSEKKHVITVDLIDTVSE